MMQQLGQVIAQQRQAAGMNQEQLAEAVGIRGGRSAMSRIESGQRALSIEQLADVAAVFGMPASSLLLLAENAGKLTAEPEPPRGARVPYTVVVRATGRVVE
jgi:transcriptional regulator with XRE-family HTH domain